MKIERIEINGYFGKYSYTYIRDFAGAKANYRVWVYSGYSKSGKEFTLTRNAFFKNLKIMQKRGAITHYTICTKNGFAMAYPFTGRVHYEKYDF